MSALATERRLSSAGLGVVVFLVTLALMGCGLQTTARSPAQQGSDVAWIIWWWPFQASAHPSDKSAASVSSLF